MKNTFQQKIVNKPWGYEYLMYENRNIALWYLFIEYKKQTSLHCHPDKKTGLILLSGKVQVEFLNTSLKLKALDKLMLRAGLFHSTKALSSRGSIIIEIETPPHKYNLIRLEDKYGRKGKPYESKKCMIPKTNNCIQLKIGQQSEYIIEKNVLTIEVIKNINNLKKRNSEEIIVILKGKLINKDKQCVLGPGDVVSTKTLNKLAQNFNILNQISLLIINPKP